MLIYIAGPLSIGEPSVVLRKVINAAMDVVLMGHTPYVPHFNILFDMVYPHSRSTWLRMDKEILAKCDALYRIPGKCKGADQEVKWARGLGIPVFRTPKSLLTYIKKH
jgi:hypothetical protein